MRNTNSGQEMQMQQPMGRDAKIVTHRIGRAGVVTNRTPRIYTRP
jgi:hypothetical protein